MGKAIAKYKIPREKLTILSKCWAYIDENDLSNHSHVPGPHEFVNEHGLSRKHIFDAVESSVRRLGTYIDVLQIHRLDKEVEAEEIMKALHDVVQTGKVRYIGQSIIPPRSVSIILLLTKIQARQQCLFTNSRLYNIQPS